MIKKIICQEKITPVPDPRGVQGRQHPLAALPGLILLSMTSGRKGMKAAFRLGRSLMQHQLKALGFRPGYTSRCHATMTQLLRILDPDAMALVFSQVIAKPDGETKADCNHIAKIVKPRFSTHATRTLPTGVRRLPPRQKSPAPGDRLWQHKYPTRTAPQLATLW